MELSKVEQKKENMNGASSSSNEDSKTGCCLTFWNLPFKLKKFMVTGIGMTTLDVFTDLVQAINHFL